MKGVGAKNAAGRRSRSLRCGRRGTCDGIGGILNAESKKRDCDMDDCSVKLLHIGFFF